MNLLKYSNWEILYLVMREHETMLSVDEILTIVSDSTKKMIIENHTISNNEAYDIEEMLSIVYKRIDNEYENYPFIQCAWLGENEMLSISFCEQRQLLC